MQAEKQRLFPNVIQACASAIFLERGLSSPQQLWNVPRFDTFDDSRCSSHCCGLESPRSEKSQRRASEQSRQILTQLRQNLSELLSWALRRGAAPCLIRRETQGLPWR